MSSICLAIFAFWRLMLSAGSSIDGVASLRAADASLSAISLPGTPTCDGTHIMVFLAERAVSAWLMLRMSALLSGGWRCCIVWIDPSESVSITRGAVIEIVAASESACLMAISSV